MSYLFKSRRMLVLIMLLVAILGLLIFTSFKPKTNSNLPDIIKRTNFPEASTQLFSPSSQTGSLTVDSNPTGARVRIDAPEEEVANIEIPVNITPFKVSKIPVGTHILTLFKEDFGLTTQEFKIEAGQTTNLTINLPPIDGNLGDKLWTTKLPMESKTFYVEYDSQNNVILATIKPTSGQPEEDIKKEVLDKLTLRGVDINKEKIEWIIK